MSIRSSHSTRSERSIAAVSILTQLMQKQDEQQAQLQALQKQEREELVNRLKESLEESQAGSIFGDSDCESIASSATSLQKQKTRDLGDSFKSVSQFDGNDTLPSETENANPPQGNKVQFQIQESSKHRGQATNFTSSDETEENAEQEQHLASEEEQKSSQNTSEVENVTDMLEDFGFTPKKQASTSTPFIESEASKPSVRPKTFGITQGLNTDPQNRILSKEDASQIYENQNDLYPHQDGAGKHTGATDPRFRKRLQPTQFESRDEDYIQALPDLDPTVSLFFKQVAEAENFSDQNLIDLRPDGLKSSTQGTADRTEIDQQNIIQKNALEKAVSGFNHYKSVVTKTSNSIRSEYQDLNHKALRERLYKIDDTLKTFQLKCQELLRCPMDKTQKKLHEDAYTSYLQKLYEVRKLVSNEMECRANIDTSLQSQTGVVDGLQRKSQEELEREVLLSIEKDKQREKTFLATQSDNQLATQQRTKFQKRGKGNGSFHPARSFTASRSGGNSNWQSQAKQSGQNIQKNLRKQAEKQCDGNVSDSSNTSSTITALHQAAKAAKWSAEKLQREIYEYEKSRAKNVSLDQQRIFQRSKSKGAAETDMSPRFSFGSFHPSTPNVTANRVETTTVPQNYGSSNFCERQNPTQDLTNLLPQNSGPLQGIAPFQNYSPQGQVHSAATMAGQLPLAQPTNVHPTQFSTVGPSVPPPGSFMEPTGPPVTSGVPPIPLTGSPIPPGVPPIPPPGPPPPPNPPPLRPDPP